MRGQLHDHGRPAVTLQVIATSSRRGHPPSGGGAPSRGSNAQPSEGWPPQPALAVTHLVDHPPGVPARQNRRLDPRGRRMRWQHLNDEPNNGVPGVSKLGRETTLRIAERPKLHDPPVVYTPRSDMA